MLHPGFYNLIVDARSAPRLLRCFKGTRLPTGVYCVNIKKDTQGLLPKWTWILPHRHIEEACNKLDKFVREKK